MLRCKLLHNNSRPIRWVEDGLMGLALLIVWIGALTLHLIRGQANSVNLFLGPLTAVAIFSGAALLTYFWANRVAPGHDPLLLPSASLLSGLGLLVISRVAPNFLLRQLIWLVIGLVALGTILTIPNQLRWLRRFKYTWLLLSLALLAATLFLGVNPSGDGARLWLLVLGIFVQPSEMLRLLMIAFLAAFLSERTHSISSSIRPIRIASSLSNLAPSALMWLMASALLFTQQDLGAAVLLLSIFVTMLYLGTGRRRLPLIGLGMLLIAGTVGYQWSARVAQRVDIWLNPWPEAQDRAFQIVQSLIAVANGGLFGQGLGQGSPGYVPAVHTDFPYAMLIEETGLLGGLGVLLLFAVLSLRGWDIARRARSRYEQLLAGGIAASIAIQVFIIVGGNLKLVPLTGVTLPLISYGGSSLCISLIGIGLLMRLSYEQRRFPNAPPLSVSTATSAHTRALHNMRYLSVSLFVILAIGTGYWAILSRSVLVQRADNPRRVDAELSIARGAILARDGSPLAYSTLNVVTGTYSRTYTAPNLAAGLGYYSTQYGNSGLEATTDDTLRGRLSPIDQLLHRPQQGAPITTTLDSQWQKRLEEVLRDYSGAAVLSNWQTGEVLALVSTPSFDANQLDAQWNILSKDNQAPLLNRALQGLYQPGQLLNALHQKQFNTPLNIDNYVDLTQLKLDQVVPFELTNEAIALPTRPVLSDTLGQGQLRLTPLRVNATVAMLMAQRPLALTLLAGPGSTSTSTEDLPTSIPTTTFMFRDTTDNGPNRAVTWWVEVRSNLVLTVALEHDHLHKAIVRPIW